MRGWTHSSMMMNSWADFPTAAMAKEGASPLCCATLWKMSGKFSSPTPMPSGQLFYTPDTRAISMVLPACQAFYMGSGIQTRVFVLLSQVLYSRRHPSAKTIILVHVDLARTLPIITSNYSSFSSEVLNRGWLSFSSCPLPGPGVLGNFWK